MQYLKITLVQTSPHWEDIPANLDHFSGLLENIGDTDLVILPEMFNTGFTTQPDHVAENMDGPTIQWLRMTSTTLKSAICGSLIIWENEKYFNRFVFITPEGDIRHYDKRHLFSMGGEDKNFARGGKRLVLSFKGWNILPMICYDLRFPVWSKNTWRDGQYEFDLMIYVASWPEVRNQAWKALLPARAMENLAYVAAVSRIGTDGNNITHSGDSIVIDPKGQPVLIFEPYKESIQTIALARKELIDFREKFNVGPDWDRWNISDF
jgi:predicted amidohydrolase